MRARLAACLCCLLPGFARGGEVLDLLRANRAEADHGLSALIALGPAAAGEVWSLLGADLEPEGLGADDPAALDRARVVLESALRAWPSVDVLRSIEAGLGSDADLAERLRAVEAFEDLAHAESFALLWRVSDGFTASQLQHPLVSDRLQEAVAAVVERDPGALRELNDQLTHLDPTLLPSVARGAGRACSAEALALLERLTVHTGETERAVIEAVGAWEPWRFQVRECDPAALLRCYLGSADADLRRRAALAIGKWRDTDSVPDLVGMLEDTDRRVVGAAIWSLREIAQLQLPEDPRRWWDWYATEEAWLAERGDALIDQIESGSIAEAVAALHELGAHPVFGEELMRIVDVGLRHHEEAVVTAAVGCAARLGQVAAIPALLDVVARPEAEARAAACAALCGLTGLALEPVASEIERALRRD